MRWLAAALAAAALAAPATARAEPVSGSELRSIAAAAERDPGARARLARIDRVDDRPVAVGAIVAGARPDEIEPRLRLALASAEASGEPARAGAAPRDAARDLLRERRYTGTDVPRPFTGALRWLGDRLAPVARLLRRVGDAIPGGSSVLYALLGALILALALGGSRRFIRRRAGGAGGAGRRIRAAPPDDPAALERAAGDAERRGDFAAAVRLRFRAGLLRLDAAEVIAYRPSLTTGEVARALRSPDFDRIGRDFDAIAYGGRDADAEAAEAARESWAAVLR